MANIGITLRSARIQRGLTIEQVAQDTRISSRFLEALEGEAFHELPAPVYVRGFLRSYANYLRLDAQPLLAQLAPEHGGLPQAADPLGGDRAAASAPARRSSDPFRPAPPGRPRIIGEEPLGPERPMTKPAPDPFSARRLETETPLDAPYDPPYRRGRVGGVLVERGAVYEDNGRVARIVALVGGGFVLFALFAVVAMALNNGGGGDDDDGVLAGGGLTPAGAGGNTPIVVGSSTVQASPSSSAETDATPSSSDATTPASPTTEAGPTSTPTPPAETPTTAPTSTSIPPTPTPLPPTPTPSIAPPPPHGAVFNECPGSDTGQPNCGSPMTVVCPPGEVWFVDYGNDFPAAAYGYPTATASSNGEAINHGQAGCT